MFGVPRHAAARDVFDDTPDQAVVEGWVVEAHEPSHTDQPKRAVRPGASKPS